jgi:long-subunit acyl-CoA synthetase (AMP-forming)
MMIVVLGIGSTSPPFREVQTHPERPGELVSILPLARIGERAVNRDLTGVNLAGHATPSTNDATDLFA